jgi:rare lipoprotein A (peptidoglycan hydrolase)
MQFTRSKHRTDSPNNQNLLFRAPFGIPLISSLLFLFCGCTITDSGLCTRNCFIEDGIASWYGHDYPARCTANGETYDRDAFTAAHKTLPFNTIVRVENLDNGKSVTVRINDRGPFVEGSVIDLSEKAASEIDILTVGLAQVDVYLVKESDNPEPDYTRGCPDI